MAWHHQRRMSAMQFREALQDLKLSQAACARYLDLSSRQIARFIEGSARVPVPIALSMILAYRESSLIVEETEKLRTDEP